MSTKTIPAVYQQCTNRQIQSKIVKRQSKQQKWPLMYQSSHVNQGFTNSIPTVYQSSKTIKNSQKTVKTAKITVGVPIVTCLLRVRRIHKVRVRIRVRRPRLPNTQSPAAGVHPVGMISSHASVYSFSYFMVFLNVDKMNPKISNILVRFFARF